MTRLTPKQKRSKDRMDALLDVAEDLIVERGAAGLALSHIAKRAGISQGSLYQYFGAREDVLDALHSRYAGQVLDILSQFEADAATFDGTEALDQLANSIVQHFAPFYAATPGYAELRRHSATVVQSNEDHLDQQIVSRVAQILLHLVPDAEPSRSRICAEVLLEITDALLIHADDHPAWKEEAVSALQGYLKISLGRQKHLER